MTQAHYVYGRETRGAHIAHPTCDVQEVFI